MKHPFFACMPTDRPQTPPGQGGRKRLFARRDRPRLQQPGARGGAPAPSGHSDHDPGWGWRRGLRAALTVFFTVLFLGREEPAQSWEYGFRDDFHFSVRKELTGERKFQIDDYVFLDAHNLFGAVDFHSGFLVTNDLNLLDAEAIQLNLAYLSIERFRERLSLDVGRQFFSPRFDAFLGDGVVARYRPARPLQVSSYFARPFNAESQAIDQEPVYVYGLGLDYAVREEGVAVPFQVSAHVERRDPEEPGALEQLLLGFEGLAQLGWPLASDLYADLEYETEDSRLRKAKLGSALYLTPMLACRLEGERYDPDRRLLNQQSQTFFQDAILNAFSRSEVVSGRAALTYWLPKGREIRVSYALQRYLRNGGGRLLGHEADCFLTFLSIPSIDFLLGAGYLARVAQDKSVHLGTFRVSASPLPRVSARLLVESGILNTADWRDRFILHVRGTLAYAPRPNLEVSLHLEENRIPYFDSDFRAMTFVRYFWGGRVEL